jgi:predicted AAA+ superfamily ATPase
MLQDILLQQKAERDKLLSKKYVVRSQLVLARKYLDSQLIKVITGPRRSGKSVFCLMLLKDKNFAYVNFDDENLLKVANYDEILAAIFAVYPEPKYFLFDEIQNLNNWEVFVNKLQRRGLNLILTGSNAKLLSRELASALTGRYLPLEILPFSFAEYLSAKYFSYTSKAIGLPESKGRLLNLLFAYLQSGGFPEAVTTGIEPNLYLNTLFDSILLKDIVKRRNLRYSADLYNLAAYLLANFAQETSFTKLKNVLGFRSVLTAQNYFGYLEEAYLIFALSRFSYKFKEQLKAPKKIYAVDNGLILAKSFQSSPNTGRLMENAVFLQLIRTGFVPGKTLFYYQSKTGRETDFIVRKNTAVETALQICRTLASRETKSREISGLLAAGRELGVKELRIITWDEEKEAEYKGKKIVFKPLWKWLLQP